MPSRRQTRGRQLAKLAARRAAERQRKRRQRLLAISIAMAAALGGLIFAVIALAGGSSKPVASPTKKPTPGPTAAPTPTVDTRKRYLMTMETSCGTIKIELDPTEAPNTVNSLVFLAGQKFFDGTLFHRTVQDFVIQGGDPNTAGGNDPSTFGTGG